MTAHGGPRPNSGRPRGSSEKLRRLLTNKAQPAIEKLVTLACGDEPNTAALKLLLDRTIAPLKPQTAPVKFELTGNTPAEYAKSILKATASGKLSPSIAVELLNGIASTMKIIEIDSLQKRLIALETNASERTR